MIKIHCLTTGWVQIKKHHQKSRFTSRPFRVADVLTDVEWSPRLPICCYLIEHPEGLIMVDTGESSRANNKGYQPWWHPFMRFNERRGVLPEEESGALVASMGFDPHDVKYVVMTHMHGDHAGGIPNFPHSRFLLTETERKNIQSSRAVQTGYLTYNYPEWFHPKAVHFDDGPFENFKECKRLTSDGKIILVPTPGHTMGHQCVIADMDDYYVLIAGDASYSEENLINGVVDGVAVNETLHKKSTAMMRELCRRKPTITLFAHDEKNEYRLSHKVFTVVPTYKR